MARRAGLVLQARVASSRLPGKALAALAGRPIVEHCLTRLLASQAGQVVLATTRRADDDPLESLAHRLGVAVYRGDTDDVLGRYVEAAAAFDLDPVLRATGDNPAVDVDAPARVLRALAASGADYVMEQGLPVGAAVEGMTFAALCRAGAEAVDGSDREHVTTYIKAHPDRFRLHVVDAPAAVRQPGLRVTVDTPADLEALRGLFARAGGPSPTLQALVRAAAAEVRPQGEVA